MTSASPLLPAVPRGGPTAQPPHPSLPRKFSGAGASHCKPLPPGVGEHSKNPLKLSFQRLSTTIIGFWSKTLIVGETVLIGTCTQYHGKESGADPLTSAGSLAGPQAGSPCAPANAERPGIGCSLPGLARFPRLSGLAPALQRGHPLRPPRRAGLMAWHPLWAS